MRTVKRKNMNYLILTTIRKTPKMNNTSIIQVLLVLKKINIVPVQATYFTVFNLFTNKSRGKKHNTIIQKKFF